VQPAGGRWRASRNCGSSHEVRPAAYQPRVGANGEPQLALDVLVVNRGRERLRSLTLLVVVIGADAKDRGVEAGHRRHLGLVPGSPHSSRLVRRGSRRARRRDGSVVELEVSPPRAISTSFPSLRRVSVDGGRGGYSKRSKTMRSSLGRTTRSKVSCRPGNRRHASYAAASMRRRASQSVSCAGRPPVPAPLCPRRAGAGGRVAAHREGRRRFPFRVGGTRRGRRSFHRRRP